MSLEVRIEKKLQSFTLKADFAADGGIFGLLGESGAGKSMLLKCIAGIEKPDSGRIVLNGRVLFDSAAGTDLAPQQRRIGYLFQEHALFPHMTAEENVMMGMRERRSRDGARAWLKSVRLDGLEERLPSQLSGGQKQRVAIARMLASEPDCVLLDEPFSALGSAMKWDLENEIRSLLTEKGCLAIFVSHDREDAYRLCSAVASIKDGAMDGFRDRRDYFGRPDTAAAAELAGVENISPVRLIEDGKIRALMWNTVLDLETAAEIKAVGIRACDLRPGAVGGIVFRIAKAEAIEEIGGYTVLCYPEGALEPLRWAAGTEWSGEPPENLSADASDILQLK